jgi:hypothetical protein
MDVDATSATVEVAKSLTETEIASLTQLYFSIKDAKEKT